MRASSHNSCTGSALTVSTKRVSYYVWRNNLHQNEFNICLEISFYNPNNCITILFYFAKKNCIILFCLINLRILNRFWKWIASEWDHKARVVALTVKVSEIERKYSSFITYTHAYTQSYGGTNTKYSHKLRLLECIVIKDEWIRREVAPRDDEGRQVASNYCKQLRLMRGLTPPDRAGANVDANVPTPSN